MESLNKSAYAVTGNGIMQNNGVNGDIFFRQTSGNEEYAFNSAVGQHGRGSGVFCQAIVKSYKNIRFTARQSRSLPVKRNYISRADDIKIFLNHLQLGFKITPKRAQYSGK